MKDIEILRNFKFFVHSLSLFEVFYRHASKEDIKPVHIAAIKNRTLAFLLQKLSYANMSSLSIFLGETQIIFNPELQYYDWPTASLNFIFHLLNAPWLHHNIDRMYLTIINKELGIYRLRRESNVSIYNCFITNYLSLLKPLSYSIAENVSV